MLKFKSIFTVLFFATVFLFSFQVSNADTPPPGCNLNAAVIGSSCSVTNKTVCGSRNSLNTIVAPPQECTYLSYTSQSTSCSVLSDLSINCETSAATACTEDSTPAPFTCHNSISPGGCGTATDCSNSNPVCQTMSCLKADGFGGYITNPGVDATFGLPMGFCSPQNNCPVGDPVPPTCVVDGYCNAVGGETSSNCPSDCPPTTGTCWTPAWVAISMDPPWSAQIEQGTSIFGYGGTVTAGNISGYVNLSKSCPSGLVCNGSTTNPQNSSVSDGDTFGHSIVPTQMGSYSITIGASANPSSANCSMPTDSFVGQLDVYRSNVTGVTVTNAAVCGANVVSWTRRNQDDLFNVLRATSNNVAAGTQIATNVSGTSFTDTTATIGTQYWYWVRIANRQSWGPAAGWVQGSSTGVAPLACPITGSCGSGAGFANGKTYTSGTITYGSDAQCLVGSPSTTAFPAAGGSVNWTCSGLNGGSASSSCSASRSALLVPSVTLSASPTSVASGGSSTISWTVSNATSCTNIGTNNIPNANWTSGTTGSVSSGSLSSNQSYRLSCTGPGGTVQSNIVTVTILAAPTVTLSASPTTVSLGGSSTISWTVANATSCVNSGANNIPNANWTSGTTGSVSSGALSSNQTYRLTCTGPGGTTQSANVTVSIAAPTVSLSASPTSVSVGGSSTISWTVANATSCVNSGANNIPNANWTTGTTGSVSSGALASSQTYRLTCTGPGGSAQSANVTVTVTTPAPTVSLSASPTTVNSGSASTLTWTISNATSCSSVGTDTMPAGSWSSGTTGSGSTGALTSQKTYRISCTGPGGTTLSANVTVLVTPAPPGGGGGGGGCNAGGCNPTPPGGGSLPTCASGVVRLYWTDNSANETNFRVYRDGALVATVATPNSAGTAYVVSYDYTPGDTNLHTYSVSAINGALESAQATIVPAPGIAASVCTPNLGGSDKDIIELNNISVGAPTPCNGSTQALPSNVTLQNGNKLTFQINVCNSGTAVASGIVITDRMINLAVPTGGWNVRYNGAALTQVFVAPGANQYRVTGTSPNQTMEINLGANTVAIGASGVVTFEAILTKPTGFNGNSARFQNSFSISATGASGNGSTPLLPFYTGTGDPEIIEVP